MASSAEYLEYVLDLLADVPEVTTLENALPEQVRADLPMIEDIERETKDVEGE